MLVFRPTPSAMILDHFAGDEHDFWTDRVEMKNEDIVRYDLD